MPSPSRRCSPACVAGPNFVTPKSPETNRYTDEALPNVALPAQGANAQVPQMWWTIFQSQKLNDTVNTALAGNRNLQAAQATLKQAQELLGVANANRMPEVTAEASNGRQKLGAAFLGGFNLPPFTYYSVGASVSYVFGLAGGMTRTVEQAAALAEAQQHELDAAHLSLTGNVVLQSLAVASARAQIRAAESVLEEDRRNVELIRKAFNEGSDSAARRAERREPARPGRNAVASAEAGAECRSPRAGGARWANAGQLVAAGFRSRRLPAAGTLPVSSAFGARTSPAGHSCGRSAAACVDGRGGCRHRESVSADQADGFVQSAVDYCWFAVRQGE